MTPSLWLLVAVVITVLWLAAAVLAVALCQAAARKRPPAQTPRHGFGADDVDMRWAK